MRWVCTGGGGPFGQGLSQIGLVVPHNLTIVVWSTEVGVGLVLQPKGLILLPPAPFWLLQCCCALLKYWWLWAKMSASSFSVREEWVCPSWAESQTKISINAYNLYTKLHKYCHMFHAICAWQKTPPSATTPTQPTKMSMHWIFKGFSLQFSSYHNHSIANLDKLILLFSKMTLDTAIKATASRNISIQICKTQRKQIALRAAELIKCCFLWICILSAVVALHCSSWALTAVLMPSVPFPITDLLVSQPSTALLHVWPALCAAC